MWSKPGGLAGGAHLEQEVCCFPQIGRVTGEIILVVLGEDDGACGCSLMWLM